MGLTVPFDLGRFIKHFEVGTKLCNLFCEWLTAIEDLEGNILPLLIFGRPIPVWAVGYRPIRWERLEA